jgi:hypothetical protein
MQPCRCDRLDLETVAGYSQCVVADRHISATSEGQHMEHITVAIDEDLAPFPKLGIASKRIVPCVQQ